jgi:hypothetical protein
MNCERREIVGLERVALVGMVTKRHMRMLRVLARAGWLPSERACAHEMYAIVFREICEDAVWILLGRRLENEHDMSPVTVARR